VCKTVRAILALLSLILATAAQLPTGATLDPFAKSLPVGNFPLAIAVAPGGDRTAILLNGWREQGLQILDRDGAVLQTLTQPAFIGLAFAPDGKSLWASGGNEDALYRYRWNDGQAELDRIIPLDVPGKKGVHYPAGLAFSPDGKRVYVAENLSDTLAVVDTATDKVVQRMQVDRYPYGIAVAGDGSVFVSAWGDQTITRFATRNGALKRTARIEVGRHPSTLYLDDAAKRLYVTCASIDRIDIVSTNTNKIVWSFDDAPPGISEGSTPNAIARWGNRLFVAEADNNAVAVIDVVTRRLLGRIPTEWYPSGLAVRGDELLVLNAKGSGTAANPQRPQPDTKLPSNSTQYTLGQINGSIMRVSLKDLPLASLTPRVAKANRWSARDARARTGRFKHVIYVIKENRTYDQVFGDLPNADGDPSLTYFPREVSPNHHALAERFGIFDRFFVNAEVSAQGHNWSTAAYTTDYTEKTTPTHYSDRGRDYDYQGTNRGVIVDEDDDVASPSAGYLWNLALKKKISFRVYGEFVDMGEVEKSEAMRIVPSRRALVGHINTEYPSFDMSIRDQQRADAWLKDFREFESRGEMPALQIMSLPNDHTSGTKAGMPTPRAHMADNDLALGRMIEALSRSKFWKDTVVFVLEDDAQSGPDHVDSHRSVLLAISAYNRPGVVHRFVNTTDVIATMEEILGLDSLSQFDHYGRPLREIFASEADVRPYEAMKPSVSMDEKNPPVDKQSASFDFSRPDAIDDALFNAVLWRAIKGDVPMPPAVRRPAGALEE